MSKLIQLTDTHLFADTSLQMKGVNTAETFRAVRAKCLDFMKDFPPDLVLLTGDLVQDNSDTAYQTLVKQMAAFPEPIAWIPGNHDEPVQAALNFQGSCIGANRHFVFDHWQVVLLDSHWSGKVCGRLAATELNFLQAALITNPTRHTLVVLHHNTIACGEQDMARFGLSNADELIALLQAHPQVKAVLCGHVHHASDVFHDGIRFITSPSTGLQLKATRELTFDSVAPGFRWFDLAPSGELTTGVERIE